MINLELNSVPLPVINGINSCGTPSYCKRKLDLLRIFSGRADQLSIAACHFARLAQGAYTPEVLASTKKAYEEENAQAREAYNKYVFHRAEHGC